MENCATVHGACDCLQPKWICERELCAGGQQNSEPTIASSASRAVFSPLMSTRYAFQHCFACLECYQAVAVKFGTLFLELVQAPCGACCGGGGLMRPVARHWTVDTTGELSVHSLQGAAFLLLMKLNTRGMHEAPAGRYVAIYPLLPPPISDRYAMLLGAVCLPSCLLNLNFYCIGDSKGTTPLSPALFNCGPNPTHWPCNLFLRS